MEGPTERGAAPGSPEEAPPAGSGSPKTPDGPPGGFQVDALPPSPPHPSSNSASQPSATGVMPSLPVESHPGGTGQAKGRRHPYAEELSTPEELSHDPRRVAVFWLGLATVVAVAGLTLASRYSPHVPGAVGATWWEAAIQVPLFAGLALLGFGFVRQPWAKRLTLLGWVLFGSYWGLVAQDLFFLEQHDYINFLFCLLGVYFFTYLAYHQWLSQVRRVDSHTVHFLNVATFVAAGSYFIIDKIEPIRRWLILVVSDHTYWMLDLFGQGPSHGLVYSINPGGSTGDLDANLTRFWYTDHVGTSPSGTGDFWANVMHFDPSGSDPTILPVSIILACTALQSIMLFVGLFMATPTSLKRRLIASAVVAVVVYVLNLVRNTGIIWFYGQGEASFWIMHDAIGKGGSLVAMVIIAFAAFAWFPEFLKSLIGVLDLPYRDGPLERALRIGRRRPEPVATPQT